MPSPVVSVTGLTKSFGQAKAVDNISFEVAPGEIFGLLGPNGAGKTTTIQMLLGVVTPDSGAVTMFGQTMPQHREAILQRCNFSSSYVSLPWNLTVRENLIVFARLYNVPSATQRIDELLQLFDLNEFRSTLTGKLSSGQLTRLFLAKALINRPELLFLDEPTASLDPDIADRTRLILKDLSARERVAMVYTSHNMAEVDYMCQRVAFIHHGRIIAAGTPAEVVRREGRENLEDLFIHFSRRPSRPAGSRP